MLPPRPAPLSQDFVILLTPATCIQMSSSQFPLAVTLPGPDKSLPHLFVGLCCWPFLWPLPPSSNLSVRCPTGPSISPMLPWPGQAVSPRYDFIYTHRAEPVPFRSCSRSHAPWLRASEGLSSAVSCYPLSTLLSPLAMYSMK